MADRYWVGGTGTWDATAGTKWSTTAGGAGGASVPTSVDNVFFTVAGNTITLSGTVNCLNLTTNVAVTFAGTPTTFSVYGNLSFAASTTWTATGTLAFAGDATGRTIATNGASIASAVVFNTGGGIGDWTLSTALTVTSGSGITIAAGTLTTNNLAVSTPYLVASTGVNSKVLNLGSSAVTVTGPNGVSINNNYITLNPGTSTITCTSATSASITTGNASTNSTFYNLTFSSTGSTNITFTSNGSVMTCNNLTFAGRSVVGVRLITLPVAGITVNGTLTCSAGSGAAFRSSITSSTVGATSTLMAAATTLTDVDFRDVNAAGAAAWTGTRLGNCGGNTGSSIGFATPKTVYWNLTGTQVWGATAWATTAAGTPAAANYPLPQDTAVFTNSGAATTVQLSTIYNLCNIDISARTSAFTLNISSTIYVYGSWTNGSGVSFGGSGALQFHDRDPCTINGAGKTFTCSFTFYNFGSTVSLAGALTTTSTANLQNGTLNLAGFTLTCTSFGSSNTNVRSIAFGTGNITVTASGTAWTTATVTNLTTSGTQVVNVTNTTPTATSVVPGALSEANSISFNITGGTYTLTFLGTSSHSARDINFTGFGGNWAAIGPTPLIYGSLTLSASMTITNTSNYPIFAATSGIETITTNGKSIPFNLYFNGIGGTWQLQDALTVASTGLINHVNGTIDLNGKTCTAGSMYATSAGTQNLTFNGGTLVCPGTSSALSIGAGTFTTTAGTGVGYISMTAVTAKTFDAGTGEVFNCTLRNSGVGALTILGDNTFNDIMNGSQPTSFLFQAGKTNTFNNWSIAGLAGSLVTIGSTSAATHTLSIASGIVESDYLSISYSTATGGATWYAGANSVNNGNNTGWIFTAPITGIPGIILPPGLTIEGGVIFSA